MPRFDITFRKYSVKRLEDPTCTPFDGLHWQELEGLGAVMPCLKLQVDDISQVEELVQVLKECKTKFYFQCYEPRCKEPRRDDYFVTADDVNVDVYTRCPKCGWQEWHKELSPHTATCPSCRTEYTVCVSTKQCPECLQRAECMLMDDQ